MCSTVQAVFGGKFLTKTHTSHLECVSDIGTLIRRDRVRVEHMYTNRGVNKVRVLDLGDKVSLQ